jgi:hypothetical protein
LIASTMSRPRITGILDFVHFPVLQKLEHDIPETGFVSVLR